jgi:glyoxylase-like metal-dependent hydrolase (beta-lactamase superfamily II)
MPAEPRIVPVACPFGTTGGVVYVYYIDAPQPALVDTGVAASPGACIEPALNAQGLSLKDVKWILATHGHWDHIGGAHSAKELAAKDVKIALHSADAELLRSRKAHLQQDGYQALRFRYLDDPASLARQEALLMENLSGELAADRELQGGERISLGGDVTIEVVPTAGHSHGSVSFLIDGPDWLCTGDGVQVQGMGPAGFPLFVDPLAYSASQTRLLEEVKPKRLYAGHRFRLADGTVLESVIDGPQVEAALRDSLAMHERLIEVSRTIDAADLDAPKLDPLRPAAEALGFDPERHETWPPSLFITLHGYRVLAASTTSA